MASNRSASSSGVHLMLCEGKEADEDVPNKTVTHLFHFALTSFFFSLLLGFTSLSSPV